MHNNIKKDSMAIHKIEMTHENDMSEKIWRPEKYDGLRKQLIPSFDMLYKSAVNCITMTTNSITPNILDIGAGTGLLSAYILADLPLAKITLSDRSESMLTIAKQRFKNNANIRYNINDFNAPFIDGSYDVIASALAIHHLIDEEKKKLFCKIYKALNPGGVFINVEQVAAPNGKIESMYDVQHEKHVLSSHTPPNEWAEGRERMKLDMCSEVYLQISWLKQVGFSCADC